VDPPDENKIPKQDLLGVTVILLTCAYRNREFVRVGYYVNNEDPDAPAPQEQDPAQLGSTEQGANPFEFQPIPIQQPVRDIDIRRVQRNILADKPRITEFSIPWDDEEEMATHGGQQDSRGDLSSNSTDGIFETAPMETA